MSRRKKQVLNQKKVEEITIPNEETVEEIIETPVVEETVAEEEEVTEELLDEHKEETSVDVIKEPVIKEKPRTITDLNGEELRFYKRTGIIPD